MTEHRSRELGERKTRGRRAHTSLRDIGVLSSSGRCCSRAKTMQLAMMVARIMYSNGVGEEELRNRVTKERGTQPPRWLCTQTYKLYQAPMPVRLVESHHYAGRCPESRQAHTTGPAGAHPRGGPWAGGTPTSNWALNTKHLRGQKEKGRQ